MLEDQGLVWCLILQEIPLLVFVVLGVIERVEKTLADRISLNDVVGS
jgi:hypothetical protein